MSVTRSIKRSARVNRNGSAVSHGAVTLTWSELRDRVARLAGGLFEVGVKLGDRVALLGLNSAAYLEAMFAVPWVGGIVVPLNTRLAMAEIAYQIADSGAIVLLADEAHAQTARKLAAEMPGLTFVSLDDEAADPGVSWSGLADSHPPREDADCDGSSIAGIFYTGGTTGKAKGVMLSHGNILHNVANLMPHLQFGPATRCLHVAPMFHIADSLAIYGVTVAAGHHFFMPKFDAVELLNVVESQNINFTTLVPTMLKMLIDEPSFNLCRLESLTDVFYGGSLMPEAILRRLLLLLPALRLHQGYGLTETSPTVTYLSPEQHRDAGANSSQLRSAGQQVYGVDLAIMDQEGVPLPVDAIGEICVKGPTVMQGYWRLPDVSVEALRGAWFRTGDIGRLDADGFLYVVDRAKDMIISGGENIYSGEVENVLLQHKAVLECAVIGQPDERWGEKVHAVVRFKSGLSASENDLTAHCRALLAGYKCPRSFEFRDTPLPLSAAGKILKSALKATSLPPQAATHLGRA